MSTREDLSATATRHTQRGVDSAKEFSNSAYEKAQGLYGQLFQQSKEVNAQVRDTTKHYWSEYPPLRWLIYTLSAFNAVPLALLIGWAVITFGIVFFIAAIGVIIVEGIFGFFGFATFLPFAAFFSFLALIVVGLATFAWGGVYVLSRCGLVDKQKLSDYKEHVRQKANERFQ